MSFVIYALKKVILRKQMHQLSMYFNFNGMQNK